MLSVDNIISEKLPKIDASSAIIKKPLTRFLKHIFHESEFNQFEARYPHLTGFDFVEQVLDYFDFSYLIDSREKYHIPVSGGAVAIANHPIGSLDGLALLQLFSTVRKDVKVVANELLWAIKPLRSLLLPVHNMGGKTPKENMKAIEQHIQSGGALLVFPAGEVSRLSPKGVQDGKWKSGFLRFAQNAKVPILPMHIDGKNSMFFYALSLIAKPISTLWLIDEMFKQQNNDIRIRVGQSVNYDVYNSLNIEKQRLLDLFKKHVYSLPKKKSSLVFKPAFESIAHPENSQVLIDEVKCCKVLGTTQDNIEILWYQHQSDSAIMREIGRLRELTFRTVGEGTGKKRDIDKYDNYYDHIILWNKSECEIVGSYRMVATSKRQLDQKQLYSETLFDFTLLPTDILNQGLELGRSFVQPKYWGKRSLDYLWQGIGAYLNHHPDIRYLLGAVSMSNELNLSAKTSLIRFYQTYFGAPSTMVKAKKPFVIEDNQGIHFQGNDYDHEFKTLKAELKLQGCAVPTLYKQYSELCELGGTQFCDFNIDPDFSDCIDGFVIVDIDKMKSKKRQRYLASN